MTLRKGHGNGAGQPRIEVLPPDELPDPVPAPPPAPAAPLVFRPGHKIADSATARELGRRGGVKKAERVRLVSAVGLSKLADSAVLKPYWDAADDFIQHHSGELARLAGGSVGSGPSSMVTSAALQLAASRYLFDQGAKTGDMAFLKQASSLANDSRQNLLAAYELATREAAGRAKAPVDPF